MYVRVVEAALERRIGQDHVEAVLGALAVLLVVGEPLRKRVLVMDVGFSTPCSIRFMAAMRSMVVSKSKPWNMAFWMCLRYGSSRSPE